MARFNVVRDYLGSGINARVYESTLYFGDYYRIVVNLKYNLFELWEIDGRSESVCFRLKQPKKTLDYLGYKLDEFCFHSNCRNFISDFCSYVNREHPTDIWVQKRWAFENGLEI